MATKKISKVAEAVTGVFISNASNKDKIGAADLAAEAILGTADTQSIADMQTLYATSQQVADLKIRIADDQANVKAMDDFGLRAVTGMRSRGMSYDGIKALWKAVSGGANLPNVLKVSCSMLQNGERLGVKITPTTLRSECAKVIKAERDKKAGIKDAGVDNSGKGTTKGEATDAQVVKQAVALLLVSADFRQTYAKQIADISARLAADNAKIAADKLTEGAAAAAKRKTA